MAPSALLTRPEPFHGCNGLISNKHATVVSHQGENALGIEGEYGRQSAPTTLITLELSKQMRYCNMSSILGMHHDIFDYQLTRGHLLQSSIDIRSLTRCACGGQGKTLSGPWATKNTPSRIRDRTRLG